MLRQQINECSVCIDHVIDEATSPLFFLSALLLCLLYHLEVFASRGITTSLLLGRKMLLIPIDFSYIGGIVSYSAQFMSECIYGLHVFFLWNQNQYTDRHVVLPCEALFLV